MDAFKKLEEIVARYKDKPPQPVAAVCLHSFYEHLKKQFATQDRWEESTLFLFPLPLGNGFKVYPRNTITLPGKEVYPAPYRLFYSEVELAEFLNRIDGVS